MSVNPISDERLAEMLAALTPYSGGFPFLPHDLNDALTELQSRRSTHEGEAVAFLHTFTRSDGYVDSEVNTCPDHPFGRAGRDYDGSAVITSAPLYAHPSSSIEGVKVKDLAAAIWNQHLFHVDALVYGDKMITPDMNMAEGIAAAILASLDLSPKPLEITKKMIERAKLAWNAQTGDVWPTEGQWVRILTAALTEGV